MTEETPATSDDQTTPAETPKAQAGPVQQLYVVSISMTSPNFVAQSLELDEEIPEEERRRKEVVYAFPKKVRQDIQAQRMATLYPIEKFMLPFYKLKLCSQDGMEEIQKGIGKGDADMKGIMETAKIEARDILAELTRQLQANPDDTTRAILQRRLEFATMTQEQLEESDPFKAEVEFLPLDLKQIAEGTLVDQIRFAIVKKVSTVEAEILTKVEKAHQRGRNLKTSSEEAILRKLENLDGLNIIGDQQLAERIDHLRSLIILHKYDDIISELRPTTEDPVEA